ncbi:MAG: permease prefix domain 1-containing protein, partial [Bacteroidetes bacterium]|nr:permease prefix domain 1-containing protein [Bacteroidota bacterium]
MSTSGSTVSLDEQIGQWRSYLRRRQALHAVDVAELEDHLREQIAALIAAGLSSDEAFLVAVKRMGALDALTREFAREHSDRLWKQLVVLPAESGVQGAGNRSETFVAFALAVVAGIFVKLPELFGISPSTDEFFYARNASLFVLPLLAGYFVWKRRLALSAVGWLAVAFVVAGVFANVYSFTENSYTQVLSALHLPIGLWFAVGVAYAGRRRNEIAGRMDFIRFSGELFIYYVLIALGGGVFTAFLAMLFEMIGIKAEWFIQ